MKNFFQKIRHFFYPGLEASRWAKIAPFLVLALIFILMVFIGTYTWEYTNSPEFCGSACHGVHPAENLSYLNSPHAEIKCVECHIGRAPIGSQIGRKIGEVQHVTASLFKNYEYPLVSHTLRPAEEVCEECHNVNKFADETHKVIATYDIDPENSLYRTFLVLNTGGGDSNQGIHWHINNTVLYAPTDESEQEIPFVRVVNKEGTATDYVDIASGFDPYSVNEEELQKMDCVTCHNRITHNILQPETAIDQALQRGVLSTKLPEIKRVAIEALRAEYDSPEKAMLGIANIKLFYQENYPDVYDVAWEELDASVQVIKDIYSNSVFPEQQMNWDTHPNNLGHNTDPGCFRCHDGKHLTNVGDGIPLACSLCHATPVMAGPETTLVHLDINEEPRPTTHAEPGWLTLHQIAYIPEDPDETCSGCHDTTNYDTADGSSFCANPACHGRAWDGLDFAAMLENESTLAKMVLQLPHVPYGMSNFETWGENLNMMDEVHRIQEEMVCADCHDPFPPSNPPANDVCISCHGETEEGFTELTSRFDPDPHDWHYGEGYPCYGCHMNYGPYKEPCALCHENIPYELKDETAGN